MSTATLYSRGPMVSLCLESGVVSIGGNAEKLSLKSKRRLFVKVWGSFEGLLQTFAMGLSHNVGDVAEELMRTVFLECFRHPSTFFRNGVCIRGRSILVSSAQRRFTFRLLADAAGRLPTAGVCGRWKLILSGLKHWI